MKIREAVSLVLTYSNKVFVIKRQNYLRSFPGYIAFPGGKIDKEDHDFQLVNRFPHIKSHHLAAIIREAKEELDLDVLNDSQVEQINYLATATSPDFNPVRFETHFFRIDLKTDIPFQLDVGEFADGRWLFPDEVLDKWEKGKLLCVPPVKKVFEVLAKNFQERIINFETRYDSELEVPHVESIKGLWQVMPLSDTVPPAERTNSFIFGDHPRVMVDPAPRDTTEISRFLTTIKKERIDLIFLTHHHFDHHRNLVAILKHLKVPIALSQDTYNRLLNKCGDEYFGGTAIKIISHGDCLTTWLGKKVICHHIPGHDEGHMGVAPESLEWFIVGDLFQGVGTVVIGGEEGDMAKYFKTLEYVISLAPACVIPSHGIALGGTYILEKTLEHRKFRESQIFKMYNEGLDVGQMLQRIYFDIPKSLYKYAQANIESHLKKLVQEGKINDVV